MKIQRRIVCVDGGECLSQAQGAADRDAILSGCGYRERGLEENLRWETGLVPVDDEHSLSTKEDVTRLTLVHE